MFLTVIFVIGTRRSYMYTVLPCENLFSQLKKSQPYFNSERYHQALHSVDYKFLLIPVAFVILRIWTCICGVLFIYSDVEFKDVPKWLGVLLINFSVSRIIHVV